MPHDSAEPAWRQLRYQDGWYPLTKLLARAAWMIPCQKVKDIAIDKQWQSSSADGVWLMNLPAGNWAVFTTGQSDHITGPATVMLRSPWRLRGRGTVQQLLAYAEHPRCGAVTSLLCLPIILPGQTDTKSWRLAISHAKRARQRDYWHRPLAVHKGIGLIINFLQKASQHGLLSTVTDRQAPSWMLLLLERIDKQLQDPALTVTCLQHWSGKSAAHIRDSFHQYTGTSPQAYLRARRFAKARDLLLHEQELSIASIADACGFADSGYFCRSFKQWHGQSPGNWRVQEQSL